MCNTRTLWPSPGSKQNWTMPWELSGCTEGSLSLACCPYLSRFLHPREYNFWFISSPLHEVNPIIGLALGRLLLSRISLELTYCISYKCIMSSLDRLSLGSCIPLVDPQRLVDWWLEFRSLLECFSSLN